MSNSQGTAGISSDAVEHATKEARKAGVFAGLTSGLTSMACASLPILPLLIASDPHAVAGVLSGYLFTQAFKDSAMVKLRAEAHAKDLASEATEHDATHS